MDQIIDSGACEASTGVAATMTDGRHTLRLMAITRKPKDSNSTADSRSVCNFKSYLDTLTQA